MSPLYLVLFFVSHWINLFDEPIKPIKSYHPPLTISLVLSANFGELRSNHFHMGLDFKTEGREGQTLHAIDEGYISRVNVSPYGYGLVVYINHPGGITSVYAHCQRLTGKLDKKIKEIQSLTESSEADIYFQPNEFRVKRGEVFALSGNSGSSSGAHLHFEIRDTFTEEAINPLFLGFNIIDTKAPSLYSLKLYALDEFGFMIDGKTMELSIKNGTIGNGTVDIPSSFCSKNGGIGFALNGVDKFDGAVNSCGIYGNRIIVNADTLMNQKLNNIAFKDTRYLNAYTDYHAFRGGKKYHKTFYTCMNPLSVYEKPGQGILSVEPNESYQIQYDAYDYSGNTSTIRFVLHVGDGGINQETSNALNKNYLNPKTSYNFEFENACIFIPEGCLYEPILKDISKSGNSIYFKSDSWPIQEAFEVKMKARSDYPIQKQYLAVKNGDNWKALETSLHDGWLEAKSKFPGEISIQIDEKAPNIVTKNSKGVIYKSKTSRLIWGLGDYQTGLANYGLLINGKWFPLTYESKENYAYFEIGDLTPGIYLLKIIAKDFSGNQREENYNIEIRE